MGMKPLAKLTERQLVLAFVHFWYAENDEGCDDVVAEVERRERGLENRVHHGLYGDIFGKVIDGLRESS